MAKMFYTLDEAAEKLSVSADEVSEMAKSGQIQEFRDRDKLMFKVDQIDMLAGGEDVINLDQELAAGGAEGSGAESGSVLGLADSREDTGISVFDTGHGEASSGDTQITDAVDEELSLESVGSGSGLLDLTRESDDTSLGAELLEEVYSSDDNVEVPAHASGLFEAAGAESPGNQMAAPAVAGPIIVESYDGAGSGLGIGLALGALIALVSVALIVTVGLNNATSDLAQRIASNLWMYTGGVAGVAIVLAVIGMVIGKSSE